MITEIKELVSLFSHSSDDDLLANMDVESERTGSSLFSSETHTGMHAADTWSGRGSKS